MAGYYLCRDCEVRLTRLPEGRGLDDLGPCSNCEATDWGAIVERQVTATLTGGGQIFSTVTAQEADTAHPVTIRREITDSVSISDNVNAELSSVFEPTTPIEDLPTEVIADVLDLGVNILRPIDGQWAIDVDRFGVVAWAAVGPLAEVLLEAAIYIERLAEYKEAKLLAEEAERRIDEDDG